MLRNFVVLLMVLLTGCQAKHEDYMQLGVDALQDQDLYKAMNYFEKAIDQDPSNTANYLVVGQVFFRLKFYQRAIYVYAAATRIDPNNAEAYLLLALSYRYKGDKEDVPLAIKAAQKSMMIYFQEKDADGFKQAQMLIASMEPVTVAGK